MLFANLTEILNVLPTTDHYGVDGIQALLTGTVHQGLINVIDQAEYRLYALVCFRLAAVFDSTEFGVGQHDLQDTFKNMPIVVCFLGDQLCHRIDLVKMTLAQRFQAVAECTREAVQHPIFDIPVFNDIGNVRRDLMDHLQILWVLLDIFPERFLIPGIRRQPESRRARIPFEAIQIVVISLD